jgi:hypothetical protein
MARESPDPGDRDRSLKSVGLGLKYLAPLRPSAADAKATTDDILNEMSPDELERFATRRVWPERFRNRLRASGASIHDAAPPTTKAEGPLAERGDDAGRAAHHPPPDPTPPRPIAAGVPSQAHAPHPHRPKEPSRQPPAESGALAAADWRRPEERVYDPPPASSAARSRARSRPRARAD